MSKRVVLVGLLGSVVLLGAGVAYALTSVDFGPRAAAWQSATCTEKLLAGKSSAANNQKVALCYAVAKAQEDDATLASLQAKVAALESQVASGPTDFTFFSGPGPETNYSPVFDARPYTQVAIDALCISPNVGSIYGHLEDSQDGTSWAVEESFYCDGNPRHYTISLGARYQRLNVSQAGWTQLNIRGRFS